jgi:hypothetical protein
MTADLHPKAVAMTTPDARRGRPLAESLAMRFPGLVRRLGELVLMRRGVPGRDALIRWAYRTAYAAYNRRDWESNTLLIYADDYVLRAGGMRRLMPDAEDEAGADVHRFRRGRLVRQTFYFDRDAGLESVGLRAAAASRR